MNFTDQELIDAEHGSSAKDTVTCRVVYRTKKRGHPEQLTPVILHIPHGVSHRALEREYGVRMLSGATVASVSYCD